MFAKIRRNFIIIAMASVSLILLISIGTINIINYRNVDIDCDAIIQEINRKVDPEPEPKMVYTFNEPPKPGEIGDNRYFIAKYDKGEMKISTKKVDAITEDECLSIANEVKESGSTSGYYSYYRFNVIDNKYIFLDATNAKSVARNFLLISIYASLGGLAAFFLLIFFASKRVLKPVKESYDKQKQFITNASHELKTPLTVISANNELLEMNGVNNEYTENISTQVEKLNKLIKNLINFSKMSEKTANTKVDVNISNLLIELTNNYKIVCDDINVKIHGESIEKGIVIKFNKEVLVQMFSLIMDNARKYANKDIYVSLRRNKNSIEFKESNDTNGIENGDLSFYTERFYRSNNNRTSIEGSGIGLSVLKELCATTKIKLKLYGENNMFNVVLTFKQK